MATVKVRYLVEKGKPPNVKFYWQPSNALARKGWSCRRLADDRATAIREADDINRQVDSEAHPAATIKTVRSGRPVAFVYVIGAAGGPVKVGFSTDPIGRMAQIQTGTHLQLQLWHLHRDPDIEAAALERSVHQELRRKAAAGEWFHASPADAAIAIVKCATALKASWNTSNFLADSQLEKEHL